MWNTAERFPQTGRHWFLWPSSLLAANRRRRFYRPLDPNRPHALTCDFLADIGLRARPVRQMSVRHDNPTPQRTPGRRRRLSAWNRIAALSRPSPATDPSPDQGTEWTPSRPATCSWTPANRQTRVKSMIRDRGSNVAAALDAIPCQRWHPERARQRADAPDECHRRTLDRRMPPRTPEPNLRLEPEPSEADPARAGDPPLPAPAHRSLHGIAPLKRCLNRLILSSTTSEDRLASVA